MADYANLVINSKDDGCVVLSSVFDDFQLAKMTQEALTSPEARRRWGHATYLRRIVFQHILDDAGFGETGWGIATEIGENDFPILVIDVTSQRVSFRGVTDYHKPVRDTEGMTLEEFADCNLHEHQASCACGEVHFLLPVALGSN